MLGIEIDRKEGIAVLAPEGPLSADDFKSAAAAIDTYLVGQDRLQGIIINTEEFPGWDSFGALVEHLQFIRDHHRLVQRVALVTDSDVGGLAEHIASHFVAAEVRHFPYRKLLDAREWILGQSGSEES